MDLPDDATRRRRFLRRLALLSALALAVGGGAGAAAWLLLAPRGATPAAPVAAVAAPPAAAPAPLPPPPPERFETVTVRLGRDQTVGQVLARLGVGAGDASAAVEALAPLFPCRKARAGDQLTVERRAGEKALQRLTLRQGRADEWSATRGPDDRFAAAKRPVRLETEVARLEVRVERSLYESMVRSQVDPQLAVLASDVLAWDVDFYQDVRNGDRLAVLVERVLADGTFLRYGEVQAVAYDGETAGHKRLFRWEAPDGQVSYFDEQGQSARRGFLKTPLKFANVTSRFGNRLHPLLGYVRAHEGVDYGAPTGTPVWAVGDGVVKQAGWSGGCGKAVTIRHRNGLESVYCHLSSIAVSAGKPVAQKQVIGAVGATGLATGPHLHFGVKRGGAYVNPAQLKVPREAPVKAEWLPAYREAISPLKARLLGEAVALN